MKLPYHNRASLAMPIVWLLVALPTLFSSCLRDEGMSEPGTTGTGKEKNVTLLISIPAGRNIGTRAIGATEENTLKTVDILAFKINGTSETFDYSVAASPASGAPSGSQKQSYTAPLRIEPYPQRFVLITNAHSEVSALIGTGTWSGGDKATMLAKLQSKFPMNTYSWNANSPSDYRAMPMWGESASETITEKTLNLSATVNLLRMTARVDVQLDTSVAGLTAKFKLKSVGTYNTSMGGNIVPAASTVVTEQRDGQPYQYVNATTIPVELQADIARHVGPNTYTDFMTPGVPDISMLGAIYLYESAARTDDARATYLVVGGLYGTDTTPTYYRVEFYKKGTKDRLDILRNFRYLFNIVSVSGRGHATADEAANSKAINMDVEVLAWNDSGMGNVMYDGGYYLSSDKGALQLFKNGYGQASVNGENVVAIQTNFPDGWKLDRIVDASDGVTPSNWLLGLNPSSGPANARTSAYVTSLANNTTSDRTALVWVKAGGIDFSIRVTQSASKGMPLVLTPVDASGKEVTELVFSAPVDTKPAAQTLTINWSPIDRSVDVKGARATGASDDFAAGSGQPANAETIIAGSGTKTYTISPPAITTAEYNANRFMEKATKFDFTVTDGITTVTKSVTIRQAIFNVAVNMAAYYTINGNSYTLNVRSNTKWVIKSITENPDKSYKAYATTSMLANKTSDNFAPNTTGGPNTASPGDPVSFTTTGQIGKWGTIDVVFASPDTPAKFADLKFTMIMVAPKISLVGIGMAANGEGGTVYNAADNRTPGDPAHMYLNNNNFGISATSTVKCEPLQVYGDGTNYNGTGGGNITLTVDAINQANRNNPDVLCICGNGQWGDDVSMAIVKQFLDKGKTVFIGIQHTGTLNSMLNMIFGTRWTGNVPIQFSSSPYSDVAPATYQIANTDHPTVNGPFGDLRGKNWGSQWDGSHAVYNLPDNVAIRYTTFTNTTGPTSPTQNLDVSKSTTAFFLKQYNLMWICDDGFFRNDNPSRTDVSPFYLDPATQKPATKQYGRDSKVDIYNSTLFANLLAWVVARYPKN